MTTHEIAGGKGLSRVEIATRARDKAKAHLEECEARLAKALEAEKAGAGKKQETEAKKQERAIKALMAVGKTEAEARKMLGLK